jgi:hypothetical protein
MTGINGSGFSRADDPRRELLRVVVLCHPGWNNVPATTFAPDARFSPSWLRWREEVLVPVFLPGIEAAQLACARGDCHALSILDHGVDRALSSDQREASRVAGATLMGGFSAPRSEKLWRRYRSLVISGQVPGHLGILCAIRGAAFHLPTSSVMSAYILLEAKGGLPSEGIAMWMTMVFDCLKARCRLGTPNLRAA